SRKRRPHPLQGSRLRPQHRRVRRRRRHPLRHRLHEPCPRRRPPRRRQRKLRLDRRQSGESRRAKSPDPNQTRTPLGRVPGFGEEICSEEDSPKKIRREGNSEKGNEEDKRIERK